MNQSFVVVFFLVMYIFCTDATSESAITGVTAQQRLPWNGKVDISYKASSDLLATAQNQGVTTLIKVSATDWNTGRSYVATSLSGDTSLTAGTHHLVWDMAADGLTVVSTAVVFTVSCEMTPATYCVVDLSGGSSASTYHVSYLTSPPSGGFNVDAYKTTKLVLRRIEPGTFMMCGKYQTTLTKPYYIGIFEMTQKQYKLVMGSNPSTYGGDMRPVENVSYNVIRGSSSGAGWPSSSNVDSSSFMGKLRARTGLNFDLPTEAQWENACRAGTTGNFNNGGSSESDLKQLGRYFGNKSDGKGGYTDTTTVGSYLPNAWGLYDMHGNVSEWCLDWIDWWPSSPLTDPKGPTSGDGRVFRGGGAHNGYSSCSSSYRLSAMPSDNISIGGFRLAREIVVSSQATSISGSSIPSVVGTPETPIISPTGGMVAEWPLTVTISCATEGASIYYTTDGTIPTATSPIYRRFRISERKVVKAVAIKNGVVSEVAEAEYGLGVSAVPTIVATPFFGGTETKVSLSHTSQEAVIRYTTDGTEPNATSAIYTEPFYVTNSCTIKAFAVCRDYFDSAVVSFAIEKVWGVGDTLGAPDHTFATDGDLPFVRVTDNTAPLGESMKSGAITDSQQSTLSTTVMGPGTISFQWKTSCEDSSGYYDWDHAEFRVDGALVAQLDGQSAWQTVTQAISGNGSHSLLWKYIKDDMSSEGEDCCWVAAYHWASAYTATQTTEVPVPYVWLRGYYPHTPDEYDAYESAAEEPAANGVNKVWECYVAGLNPTNVTDLFRTEIWMEGGKPVIDWTPDLNEGGTKQERVYTVEGRESLASGSWGPTNAASRFFKVRVTMP